MTAVAQLAGTVYVWLGSFSHVTAPFEATLIYLYSITVPAATVTVPFQTGEAAVYSLAERAITFAVFQLPSSATLPAILMVWPNTVVTVSRNVTATLEAGEHAADVLVAGDVLVVVGLLPVAVVVVGEPEMGV